MVFDLVAGTKQQVSIARTRGLDQRRSTVLVFDSGLGGLSVFPEVARVAPGASLIYVADDAVFPYGRLSEERLVERVMAVMAALIADHDPDVIVIACHTASTAVLPPLRARWPGIAFVGTVPAIKPAATASQSKMVSVLATPGTVVRQYTRDLIRTYAGNCSVTLVGATALAGLAENAMAGDTVAPDAIAREIAPAFVESEHGRTDTIVLACTHYPLILPEMMALAPWPVRWIDPASAIARRVEHVLMAEDEPPRAAERDVAPAFFTSNRKPGSAIEQVLAARGLAWQPATRLAALHGAGLDA